MSPDTELDVEGPDGMGDTSRTKAEGEQAEEAVRALVELVAARFEEDE